MRRIYVASSWRNQYQPHIVHILREAGHAVFDFRHPKLGNDGFHWSKIDPNWQAWTQNEYLFALRHPLAQEGYANDFGGMEWADTCVLVLPCGRSAHLEMGWCIGSGRYGVIYMPEPQEPDLMNKMAQAIVTTESDLLHALT